jgi:hypothetical protein
MRRICLGNAVGVFELQQGRAEAATRHFAKALAAFEAANWRNDTARAATLAAGDVLDAAVASADILDLLLVAGRFAEVPTRTGDLIGLFAEAGMQPNALEAWAFLRDRARAGALTRDDVADVRAWFQELPLRPKARFVPFEGAR